MGLGCFAALWGLTLLKLEGTKYGGMKIHMRKKTYEFGDQAGSETNGAMIAILHMWGN
jgi:hypothetical protein